MLILCVTHGEVDYGASGSLNDIGRANVDRAARKCRELVGKESVVVTVISSPRIRCVETAVRIASELGRTTQESLRRRWTDHPSLPDDIPTTQLRIADELDEIGDALSAERLIQVLDRVVGEIRKTVQCLDQIEGLKDKYQPVGLLVMHAGLPNALSISDKEQTEQTAKGVFFKKRAGVVLLDYEAGRPLSDQVRYWGFP
jgi:broad specificity phosphatase PhoE